MVDSMLPGSVLGRYQIVEGIGRGGMASVFRAVDPELNRDVAIKVLPSFQTEDPTFVERFRQEAQAVARLTHPNIIRVHDFGEDKGFTYIVMEYVTGGTLMDRLNRQLPLADVVDLVSPIAQALDYAHGQGIVHRDIKPANVLLDANGTPILTDFGLARMLEGGAALTRAGAAMGTPEYMAPEQALGRTVDQKADLYAFGVVVYQMLTRKLPFRGDTPSQTLMAHIHEPLPLPTTQDPSLEKRLDAILTKALAKDPDARYQTAGAFVAALASPEAKPDAESEFELQPTLESAAAESDETGVTSERGAAETAAPTGRAGGAYFSMDRARVLAMSSARETPGAYGRRFADIPMAFEVVTDEETEDHYVITLSFRPQGAFDGTPGQEQFFVHKDGTVAHRQVLSLPATARRLNVPLATIVAAIAVVLIAAVGAVIVFSRGDSELDSTPEAGATDVAPQAVAAQPTAPAAIREAPTPSAIAPAVGAAQTGAGTAVISDDQTLSDSITYELSDVAPPAAGKQYVGWLVSDDGSAALNTGPMIVQADGSMTHTFDRNSPSYTGESLIHTYVKVLITEEESGASPQAPTGPTAFSHEVPLGAMVHIRHLLTNWPEGSDKGILTNLKGQLSLARFHAGLANKANGISGVRQHTEHVVNILEGSGGPNFGDLDANGTVENPGDAAGVLTHASERKHAAFSAGQAPDDRTIGSHAEAVLSAGESSEQMARLARDRALEVLATDDMVKAKELLGSGESSVIGFLDAALSGSDSGEGAEQAYVEAQRMATFVLQPESGTARASIGSITFGLTNERVYRIEARGGAEPEEISLSLDAMSPGGRDVTLNTSPNGRWLVLSTHRMDAGCGTWPCVALAQADLSVVDVVRTAQDPDKMINPGQGLVAVDSRGSLIVYQQEGVASGHIADLFAITRQDGSWNGPILLTGDSPFQWHQNPALSDDGSTVAFQCGNSVADGHAICEVSTDGTGFRTVLTPADSPPGGPDTGHLQNPDYAPDGSFVFSANWDGDGIWRLPSGEREPVLLRGNLWWPCVLPDGRIAVGAPDSSKSESNPDLQLGVMTADGTSFTTLATVEQGDAVVGGLGCGD